MRSETTKRQDARRHCPNFQRAFTPLGEKAKTNLRRVLERTLEVREEASSVGTG